MESLLGVHLVIQLSHGSRAWRNSYLGLVTQAIGSHVGINAEINELFDEMLLHRMFLEELPDYLARIEFPRRPAND